LANIKSQIKRNRQSLKRRLRNRFYRGAARSAALAARGALEAAEPTSADSVLRAISLIDKAAERGVLHPNNAARRKGRLMRRLAAFGGPGQSIPMATSEAGAGEAGSGSTAAEGGKKPARKPAAKKSAAKKTPARRAKK
jgi:small subunit ribosomal protein S20